MPLIDIARRRDHREADRRHEAADPAVADMIGQGQRAVADARREQLDEQGRERAIDHRREDARSEEHTSELQSLMRRSYAVFCLKNKQETIKKNNRTQNKL